MKQQIFNIAYLHDKNPVANETINSLSKSYAETSKYKGIRTLFEFPLYLDDITYEPSIDFFITKLVYSKDFYHLVLVDFVPRYDGRQSSLRCLLSAFNEHHIKIPWILLNGPDDETIVKQDLIDSFPQTNISNLKYFHNFRNIDKKKILSGDKPVSEFFSSTIEKNILELEENDFLRYAISGEKFIKTLHIPGFKDINDNCISLNLTNEKCNMPDYFVFGGDYLLSIEDKRFTLLFNSLESKCNGSKFLYAKSCSDEDKMFVELLNEQKIDHTKTKIEETSKIVPFIIRNEEMPLTILNICFSQTNEQNSLELTEQDYNSIRKEIESIEEYSSKFETDIKIIYCHYDLFYRNGTDYLYNINLEKYLKDKGFFLLIHDHTHDVKNLHSKHFIHLNKEGQGKISGIPRIAGGHFDNNTEKSELRPFYLSFNFIQDKTMPYSIKSFDFKVWMSSTENKKNDFLYDDFLTRDFNSTYNNLTQNMTEHKEALKKNDQEEDLKINVLILTAIGEEYKAVRDMLIEIVPRRGKTSGSLYETGIFQYQGKNIARIFLKECGQGNIDASEQTLSGRYDFDPDMMLFVGIAGTIKERNFGPGDVIFPHKIGYYEDGKAFADSETSNANTKEPDPTLLDIAKIARHDTQWRTLINDDNNKWKNSAKADIGVISSGEKIIEDKESVSGKKISKDSSVVDKESFGFLKAASSERNRKKDRLYGVIRGIIDVVGESSNSVADASKDFRPSPDKQHASQTAAAFAYWLICKVCENQISENNKE